MYKWLKRVNPPLALVNNWITMNDWTGWYLNRKICIRS